MTNNSIFKRVLSLALCVLMLAGVLTSCFQMPEFNPVVSTPTPNQPNAGTTTGDKVENNPTDDPVENPVEPDPVDPNELFSGTTTLANDALIYGALANDVFIGGEDGVAAMIPADVKVEAGASSLSLSVKKVEDENLADALSNLDVHISGVALDNTVPMTVLLGAILPAGLGLTELKLYHIENGTPVAMMRVNSVNDFAIHNQYVYDAETGNVTIYVASFSVFSAVQTTASKWEDDTVADTSWYNENDTEYTLENVADFLGFRDLVDAGNTFEGKTVTLATDIDLDNKLFNPIGGGWAYNGGKTFNGTFDGGNHTIYNLYVNGWELDATGDKHSSTSMGAGLFSSIHNATIKNISVVGSELIVETTSIGIIAGCAQGKCTFENIIVSDATLGNYQMRNGGIVGDIYVIDSDNVPEGEYSHTFTNIVVDSSVKLSSMWGDFDTGNGGVIGGKYGSSKVLMQNVIVAAELDVFSDVTAAYQWYAYRRCGMLVGYTGQNSPKQATNAAADFLTCENVNVYYGDWVNYTYYQFTNQDSSWQSNYPWVRAQESPYNGPFSNVRYGNPVVNGEKINTLDLAEANKTGFAAITFNQLYGGGQGVYGTNEHDNVTIHNNLASAKTIYILNNAGWENLKLQYWFRNGDDTWTTNIDGIDMSGMYLSTYNVYKIELPAYADGFRIVADNENSVEFTLADLTDGETYTVGGDTHEHDFGDGNKCECGAYKIQKGELVTDINDLNASDKIIIVAANSSVALSTTQNSNNRKQVAIVKNEDGTVTINANVQIITLEVGKKGNTFAFNVGESGYLYAASDSSNNLKTEKTLSNNSSWLITIDENGVATIKAQGENTHNWLKYNSSSSLFSCYLSGQQDIAIYKLSEIEEIVEAHDCKDFAFGATCEDNAICSTCSNVIEDSALGHNYIGKETTPTCTDAGYTTYSCSRCDESYKEAGADALGHEYIDGICHCGAVESAVMDFSGRYYIATIRTTGNYFYMTNTLGTASTKRYQAIDSGLTTLPGKITNVESDKIFVLEKNEDGTYSIYAEGIDGNNYLGWTSENSGILVAKKDALKLTVDKKEDGTYNIHFTGDSERYLALNQSSGSNYFAWYKSGQKQDLTLIPVNVCEHTNKTTTTVDATCTEAGSTTVTCDDCGTTVSTTPIAALGHTTENGVCERCDETIGGATHECEHKCETCDGCTNATCEEDACANKCKGHEPTWTLVTDASTLQAGDKIIIVAKDYDFALSTIQNTNNRGQIAIRKDGNTLTIADGVQIITLEVGTADGTFAFYTGSGYLYAASSGSNHLKTQTTNNANGSWKITIADDGTATIVAQGTYTRNTMQYNQSSSLFACYASATQKAIAIYKLEGGNNGGGEDSGETEECTHSNTTETTTATCETSGVTTVTCNDCGETVRTTNVEALGHTTENGECERCHETIGGTTEPTEPELVATFTLGENGSASHSDGSSASSYSETNNGYTLTLSSMSNVYKNARDAKGNSCLKLGTGSAAGKFTFTVPENVTSVVIYVAQYKANTTKITVNDTSYTITTASNNGEYTAIEIDTSTTKTVTLTTVSGGYRAMVNTIEFIGIAK